MPILRVVITIKLLMYLVDTNVISELRKKSKVNRGVKAFFKDAQSANAELYLSVITIGELRRGVELIRHRGDVVQAEALEKWLVNLVTEFRNNILDFTDTEAQVWGRLRVPNHEHALDKQIAATALINNLCVVTRNTRDFKGTGVDTINPFN